MQAKSASRSAYGSYSARATQDPIDFDKLIGPTVEAKERFATASYALEAAALVRQMRQTADGGHPINQSELARRLNVSSARVSMIESGDGPSGPTFALLRRIAHACRVGFAVSITPMTDESESSTVYRHVALADTR
jgi:DNA-binding transcriptional regulator YiaG